MHRGTDTEQAEPGKKLHVAERSQNAAPADASIRHFRQRAVLHDITERLQKAGNKHQDDCDRDVHDNKA